MPSSHSSVSTRRAVRCQSIAGTWKPGSATMLLGKLGGGGRLAAQIELARGPLAEHRDDEARAQPRDLAAHALGLRRGPFIGLHRAREFVLDAGAQHLDRDVRALGGDRAVDLRDRGGADGHLVDRGEQALDRACPAPARSPP